MYLIIESGGEVCAASSEIRHVRTLENGVVSTVEESNATAVYVCSNDTFYPLPAYEVVEAENIPDGIPAGALRYENGTVSVDTDALKLIKSQEIKSACEQVILSGFDADVLGRGSLHYTLTEIQQRDLQSQYAAVKAGATGVFWHDTSRVTHETYTAAQFKALFNTGYAYMISCKIRSDWLEQLAHDLADAGQLTEAAAVDWSTVLPESYKTQCDAQVAAVLEAANV